MKLRTLLAAGLVVQVHAAAVCASPAVESLLQDYRRQGAVQFDPETGQQLWNHTFSSREDGSSRSCASCHTDDPRRAGEHAKTGKRIEPLAPSVNPKRLTNIREIRKWFGRNCKWTLGRACTAQEKGDLLMYLSNL